jgi:hypothetical protein
MLRFDRRAERGTALAARLGRTNLAVLTFVGAGLRHKYFRNWAQRAGCDVVRQDDARRLIDIERENAALKALLADAGLEEFARRVIGHW